MCRAINNRARAPVGQAQPSQCSMLAHATKLGPTWPAASLSPGSSELLAEDQAETHRVSRGTLGNLEHPEYEEHLSSTW